MCRKAVGLGVTEIGFAEHVDFDPKDWGFGFFNYDRYSDDLRKAREVFKGKLVIRKGVEIDYQRRFEDEIREWLRDKRFDFVIGSVHYLDHKFIDHQYVASNDLKGIYAAYIAEVVKSVRSRLFDVVGHLDLIRKFNDNRSVGLRNFVSRERFRSLFEEITEKRMYLEVNSKLSVLAERCTDTMPSKGMIEEYIEAGGELVSIGSDAHTTEELGKGIPDVLDFLERYDENQVKLLFGETWAVRQKKRGVYERKP